jgi:Flp pilus assembly protein TadG
MRQRLTSERGAELIEFAMVLPLLLMLIFGIVDFGFMFQRYLVVTNAAREGARMASLPNYQPAQVQARVNAYIAAGGLTGTATTPPPVTESMTVAGRTFTVVRVTVSYAHDFVFLGPLMDLFGDGLSTTTLTAAATMRLESQGS